MTQIHLSPDDQLALTNYFTGFYSSEIARIRSPLESLLDSSHYSHANSTPYFEPNERIFQYVRDERRVRSALSCVSSNSLQILQAHYSFSSPSHREYLTLGRLYRVILHICPDHAHLRALISRSKGKYNEESTIKARESIFEWKNKAKKALDNAHQEYLEAKTKAK